MEKNNNGKGLSIAGFVLSLVGIVLGFLGTFFSIAGLPVAIVGLVLSVVGRKKCTEAGLPTGFGTAGLVLGIIATVITAIFFFTCGICTICVANEINAAANSVNSMFY